MIKLWLFILFFYQLPAQQLSAPKISYYIDAVKGNDAHDGKSPMKAWKTLEKVNKTTFSAGNHILFRSGQSWEGQLHPKGSGKINSPIVIGSFGAGNRPLIAGRGINNAAIYLYNQEYWEITNLEVTNYDAAEQNGTDIANWEKQNTINYVKPILPPQLANQNKAKYGIFVLAEDAGELHHIVLKNLEIHGVNGYINQADEASKENGGVFFKIIGNTKPTYFNGVLIASCNIHDVDRTGVLLFNSTWSQRTLIKNINWTPSVNVIIRDNKFSNTGANALVVRVAKDPLIEQNVFDRCAIKASGNAGFSFNTDGATWQYNECRFTKANLNDRDAGGIDSDYKSKNTILQYNYVHDNDYGMLITGGPANFNDSTIVRYNVFENDGKFPHPSHKKCVIRVSGSATNTHIYNNVIFLGADQVDTKIVSHEVWKTSPNHTLYQNNIFYNLGTNTYCDFEQSTANLFENNLYYGNVIENLPIDKFAIREDPRFIKNGKGMFKYQLQKGSAALNSGISIQHHIKSDLYRKILNLKKPNIGVDGGQGR